MGSRKKSRLSVGKKGKVLRPRKRVAAGERAAAEVPARHSTDRGQERYAAPASPHSPAAGPPASAKAEAAVPPVRPGLQGCAVACAAAGHDGADPTAMAVEALFLLHAVFFLSQRAE